MPKSGTGSSAKHMEDCTSGQRVLGTRSIGGWLEPSDSPEIVGGKIRYSSVES